MHVRVLGEIGGQADDLGAFVREARQRVAERRARGLLAFVDEGGDHRRLGPTFGRLAPSGVSLAPETLSWKEAEQVYGVRVVLDKHEGYGVSLLTTREPISEWEREVEDFPSGEDLTAAGGYALGNIDARRAAASSRGYVGEGGKIQERWRCPTLLTALYVML